ncbi:hypothetical protein ABQX22_22785 [Xanthomonas sp. WHRI 1810A]|uniref:hypothetical protein n=1 Tax=Xanthomonas sp. WHRI 1810A TaxID=3161565 RepID=UPI0032E87853
MEISENDVRLMAYGAKKQPAGSREDWVSSEGQTVVKPVTMYSVQRLMPRTCNPETISEEQMLAVYSREEDPWGTDMVPLSDAECCWTCRSLTTWHLSLEARNALEPMETAAVEFLANLRASDPDLSQKEFALALNDKNEINVIDKHGTLTAHEIYQITQSAGQFMSNFGAARNRYKNTLLQLENYYKNTTMVNTIFFENKANTKAAGHLAQYSAAPSSEDKQPETNLIHIQI